MNPMLTPGGAAEHLSISGVLQAVYSKHSAD